jgi:hypothetical protein
MFINQIFNFNSMSNTAEYNVFGINNLFSDREPHKHQTFTDEYLFVGDRGTLKRRSNGSVRYKAQINGSKGVQVFQNERFDDQPNEDPLKGFLKIHNLTERYGKRGIILDKTRFLYLLDDEVQAYYGTFRGDREDSYLTLVARRTSPILNLVTRLGIEENINFREFLLQ